MRQVNLTFETEKLPFETEVIEIWNRGKLKFETTVNRNLDRGKLKFEREVNWNYRSKWKSETRGKLKIQVILY